MNKELINNLKLLKLTTIASILESYLQKPEHLKLSLKDSLEALINEEISARKNRKIKRLTMDASLPYSAISIDSLIDIEKRGINRDQIYNLFELDFIKFYQNIIITGPTGIGKTYLSELIGQIACNKLFKVKFIKAPVLTEMLKYNHKNERIMDYIKELSKYNLIIIDEFGLIKMETQQIHDLLTIINFGINKQSLIINSQLTIKEWHNYFSDPILSNSILDRLFSNSHIVEMKGESLRKSRLS